MFFLPKFFEIRSVDKTYHIPVSYNCSEELTSKFENSSEFPLLLETYSMTRINSTIPNIFQQDRQPERVCNECSYLINNLMDNEVPIPTRNDTDNGESSIEVITDNTMVSKDNITLFMDYNISTHVATVYRRHVVSRLDQTDMRKNTLYYKIYILGLTTLCAQIIPMSILIYLNIKICLELRTSTGNVLSAVIRNQRKKYAKRKSGNTSK